MHELPLTVSLPLLPLVRMQIHLQDCTKYNLKYIEKCIKLDGQNL